MQKYILTCLIIALLFLVSPTIFGEDDKPVKEQLISQTHPLKPVIGLPDGFDKMFLPNLGTLNERPLTEKPEELKEVPEGLKDPVYFKVTMKSTDFFGVLTRNDKDRYDKYYLDTNHDGKLDEKPVNAVYSNTRPNFLQAHFEILDIKVKDKECGFFLRYYANKFTNKKTNKLETFAMVYYGLVNSWSTNIKLDGKEHKLVVVDKFADNKINMLGRNGDLIFLDVNADGKFGWASGASETLDGSEFTHGEYLYKFKIDLENKIIFVEPEKLTFGKILFKWDNVNNLKLNIAKGLNNNSPQLTLPVKDGVVTAPVGKFIVKSVEFDKDGKHYQLNIKSFSTTEMISITKDKPVEYKINLHMIYKISPYDDYYKVEGKRTFRLMGYVYNRRTFEVNGKEITLDTRTQPLVDGKEPAPPIFTLTDGEGKVIIKDSAGKPFC